MKRTMRLEGATALLIASLSGGAVHAAMDPGGVIEKLCRHRAPPCTRTH